MEAEAASAPNVRVVPREPRAPVTGAATLVLLRDWWAAVAARDEARLANLLGPAVRDGGVRGPVAVARRVLDGFPLPPGSRRDLGAVLIGKRRAIALVLETRDAAPDVGLRETRAIAHVVALDPATGRVRGAEVFAAEGAAGAFVPLPDLPTPLIHATCGGPPIGGVERRDGDAARRVLAVWRLLTRLQARDLTPALAGFEPDAAAHDLATREVRRGPREIVDLVARAAARAEPLVIRPRRWVTAGEWVAVRLDFSTDAAAGACRRRELAIFRVRDGRVREVWRVGRASRGAAEGPPAARVRTGGGAPTRSSGAAGT